MLSFNKEYQLLKPVSRFLKNKYLNNSYEEVAFHRHNMDLFTYSKKSMETISVELKLKKWKKALQQALIYQLCSDYVYVAMPKSAIRKAILHKFKKFGIGIIAVYPSKYCRTVLEPRKSKVVNKKYKYDFIAKIKELEKR